MIKWLGKGMLIVTSPKTTTAKKRCISDCVVRAREQRVWQKILLLSQPRGKHREFEDSGRRRKGRIAARTPTTRAKRTYVTSCTVPVSIQVPLPPALLFHTSTEGACNFGDSKFVRQAKYRMHRHGSLPFLPTSCRSGLPILKMVDSSRRHNQTACYLNGRMHPMDPRRSLYESRRAPKLGRDPHGSAGRDGPYRDVCLVHALQALGVDIKVTRDGPFRANEHGNPMLAPFGKKLMKVPGSGLSRGKYVVWRRGHFMAVLVQDQITVIEKNRTMTYHSASEMQGPDKCIWWHLRDLHEQCDTLQVAQDPTMALADDVARHIDQNWSSAKRRKASLHSSGIAATSHSLTQEQLERIRHNRETAIRIRSSRLVIPRPPSSWDTPRMPNIPTDWLAFDVVMPHYTFLEHLHAHPRDRHIVFFAETHTYLIRGRKSLGSVTGVVHAFAQEFQAHAVIQQMMTGSRWPRPGYLQEAYPAGFLEFLACSPYTAGLAEMLRSQDRDERAICAEVRRLVDGNARLHTMVPVLAMTESQIMQKWDDNRVMAANMGTWMHFTFEAFLNSCPVESDSMEFRLFLKFVASLAGLSAYRTEWTIYGDEEMLAGSIDFVAMDAAGELVLFDWKRSKDCVVVWCLRPLAVHPQAHNAV